jgi:hypothetical protein
MEKAKRARKAETPRQPSLCLRLRATYLYPDPTATALRSSTFWRVTIAVGCSHVSGLLVQPFFTTAGPDVVREGGS